jgi:hypothetical protein
MVNKVLVNFNQHDRMSADQEQKKKLSCLSCLWKACDVCNISRCVSSIATALQDLNVHIHHFTDKLLERRVTGVPTKIRVNDFFAMTYNNNVTLILAEPWPDCHKVHQPA